MLLTRLLNDCYHLPGFVYDRAQLDSAASRIAIFVRPRSNSQGRCSVCHQAAPGYDRLGERRFEFIPLWGYAVELVYSLRRVACSSCGVKVEEIPWAHGKQTLCEPYVHFLAYWARKLSWKEVAQTFKTTWHQVCAAVQEVVQWGLEHRTLGPLEAIGVDEIQYGRGHRYLTLVYQIDAACTRLLWVGEERTQESFERFFKMIGKSLAEGIQFVCSDMWKPYLKLIAKHCPNALNVLDRYHVVAKMNKAIDEVRAGEARRLVQDGYDPVLKKSRWCLLKRRENLTDTQRIKLRDLLRYNLKTIRAYLLKEDFQQFWDYSSPTWAGKFLDAWCRQVMYSRIEPMKKFARTLRKHRTLLLNYFHARKAYSSGVVEGLNNKAKVTMRRSYGFRTFKILELSLYHTLGKLPQPQLAHRFF